MHNLSKFSRRWQNKTEVKFLQGFLNQFEGAGLSVDGDYGDKTVSAVKAYQKKYGLQVDGSAGQQTLRHMGFRTAKNQNIVLLEIPFAKISKANVLLKNGEGYSCERFAREMNYDIVFNGAFFQMSTHKVVQLLARKGKVDNWGMGEKGIAFPNNFDTAFMTSVKNIIGKEYDMEGGAPSLIYNYRLDNEGIKDFKNPGTMNSKTRRNCLGLTDNSFVLMFTIGNVTLYDMANEAIYQKLKYAIGLDGGGSQSLYMGGAWIITTDGRKIPAAIGLEVKK
jgi:hypothetical protein